MKGIISNKHLWVNQVGKQLLVINGQDVVSMQKGEHDQSLKKKK